MKQTKRFLALFCLIAVLAVSFSACAGLPKSPQKLILGKWKDSTGLVGYEFMEDGTVKFSVLGVPVTGTYVMDTKEQTVTLTGTVLVKSYSQTYKFELEESKLTLTDQSSNNVATYMRVTTGETTTT